MPRVSSDTINKLNTFIDSLPEEARSKCALCNETLTHIVKQAEAQTGAGTATVTRELSNRLNEGAADGDKVTGESLRQKVIGKTTDKNLSVRNEQITNHTQTEQPQKPSRQKDKPYLTPYNVLVTDVYMGRYNDLKYYIA